MQNQWKNQSAWSVLGSDNPLRIPAPQLPPRPTMRVTAIGRSFCVDARHVPVGEIAVLDVDDARRLIDAGKAEPA